MRVDATMSTDILCAEPTTLLSDIGALFHRHAISSVPILDDGALVGLVSQSDVIEAIERLLLESRTPEPSDQVPVPAAVHHVPHNHRLADLIMGMTAHDVMTTEVMTIEGGKSVTEAARIMAARRVHRLPVLERGHLVGVISALDIVGYVADHPDLL